MMMAMPSNHSSTMKKSTLLHTYIRRRPIKEQILFLKSETTLFCQNNRHLLYVNKKSNVLTYLFQVYIHTYEIKTST
jgi:hypothetical protein